MGIHGTHGDDVLGRRRAADGIKASTRQDGAIRPIAVIAGGEDDAEVLFAYQPVVVALARAISTVATAGAAGFGITFAPRVVGHHNALVVDAALHFRGHALKGPTEELGGRRHAFQPRIVAGRDHSAGDVRRVKAGGGAVDIRQPVAEFGVGGDVAAIEDANVHFAAG